MNVKPKLVIEVRPRLQSCQVFYRVAESVQSLTFTVEVQNSSIKFKSEGSEDTFTFDDLSLKSQVLHDLKLNNETIISCRFPMLSFTKEDNLKTISKKYIPNVEKEKPVNIICRCCHSELLNEKVCFSRILPLPSADVAAGDFFCHGCCNDDFESKHNTDPKPFDLLYGNYFFKVTNNLISETKTIPVKDLIYCQRCRTWLGSKDNVAVKMWNCTVYFGDSVDSSVTPIGDFISVVKSIIQDSEGAMCKIVISCKHDSNKKEYLLLWIMDKSLPLLVSCDSSKSLVTKHTVKLLYCHEKSHTNLVSQWEKDINTNCVDVAEIMFTEGIEHLNRSNALFPTMFRQANGMSVGYLDL